MMTWTLYLLLVTSDGQYMAMESRTYSKPGQCQAVAKGLKGKPISNAVIYTAVCTQLIHT